MKAMLMILMTLIILIPGLDADVMPDFRLPDANNHDMRLSDILGKGPVLIEFWASWCTPCKASMTQLDLLQKKYDSLTVVVISIDAPKDISKAKNYLKSKGFGFIALFDTEKRLAQQLNVTNPPHTFILDSEGRIVYSHVSYKAGDEAEYEEQIIALLPVPEDPDPLPESSLPGDCQ